jgi:hypothetical protein
MQRIANDVGRLPKTSRSLPWSKFHQILHRLSNTTGLGTSRFACLNLCSNASLFLGDWQFSFPVPEHGHDSSFRYVRQIRLLAQSVNTTPHEARRWHTSEPVTEIGGMYGSTTQTQRRVPDWQSDSGRPFWLGERLLARLRHLLDRADRRPLRQHAPGRTTAGKRGERPPCFDALLPMYANDRCIS